MLMRRGEQLGMFGAGGDDTEVRAHVRRTKHGVVAVKQHRRKLHDTYGPQGAPRPGERGYKPEQETPPERELLDRALEVYETADFATAWQIPAGASGDDAHELYGYGVDRLDAYDMLGVPTTDEAGDPAPEWREVVAEKAVELAGEVIGLGMDKTVAAAILRDAYPDRKTHRRLVNVPLDRAAAFIREHHSALPDMNRRGLMYAVGLEVEGRLVAVATAGTPSGPWSDPHGILELHRVASDGSTLGASSQLVARLIDLLPRSARRGEARKLVTYQLLEEAGTTYLALRDKGLRPVGLTDGKVSPSGARAGSAANVALAPKIRWEAGPAADEADWLLVRPHNRAMVAGRWAAKAGSYRMEPDPDDPDEMNPVVPPEWAGSYETANAYQAGVESELRKLDAGPWQITGPLEQFARPDVTVAELYDHLVTKPKRRGSSVRAWDALNLGAIQDLGALARDGRAPAAVLREVEQRANLSGWGSLVGIDKSGIDLTPEDIEWIRQQAPWNYTPAERRAAEKERSHEGNARRGAAKWRELLEHLQRSEAGLERFYSDPATTASMVRHHARKFPAAVAEARRKHPELAALERKYSAADTPLFGGTE
jgi:hypothetical protein